MSVLNDLGSLGCSGNSSPDLRAFELVWVSGGVMFQYFVKIVPTMYVYSDQVHTLHCLQKSRGQEERGELQSSVSSHQFSVTTNQKEVGAGSGDGLPGFFVQYDFSPLIVKFTERRKSLSHFLVSLCAIVGGIFTVASLLDAAIYHSAKALQAKVDLGKAG